MTWKGARTLFFTVKCYSKLHELTVDRNILDGSKLKLLKETLSYNRGLNVLNMNYC